MKRILAAIAASAIAVAPLSASADVDPAENTNRLIEYRGKTYWLEDGQIQGAYGDPKNIWDTIYGIERGREIYDPQTDAWYWLDACYDGAVAKGKEVWFPYVYQEDLLTGANPEGKWVRYDNAGGMIKYFALRRDTVYHDSYACGYRYRLYFYDPITGALAKGFKNLYDNYDPDNPVKIRIWFDKKTGVCEIDDMDILETLSQLHLEEWPCYDIYDGKWTDMTWVTTLMEPVEQPGKPGVIWDDETPEDPEP